MRPAAVDDGTLLKLTPFCDWFRSKVVDIERKYVGIITTAQPVGFLKIVHCSREVTGPELSRQHSREAQVITALSNNGSIQNGCRIPPSSCRGDTLPPSDSLNFSSQFYASSPTCFRNSTPSNPTQEVHDTDDSHSDSNPKDRECGNSDSSGSSSTVRASSSDSNKCQVLFTTQLSHNSVNEPDTEVDELASTGAVQGQIETNGGSKNELFVSHTLNVGFCNVSGAGGNDSPCQEIASPTKHTSDRELPPSHGDEGVVKRTSREVRLEYPVQESGISCGSDIVVAVPSIPRRIGLVFGSDMYVCT